MHNSNQNLLPDMEYCKMPPPSYPGLGVDEGYAGGSNLQKDPIPADTFTGPVEKRRRTDVGFLIFFGSAIIIWLLISFYCMANGDLNRLQVPKRSQSSTNVPRWYTGGSRYSASESRYYYSDESRYTYSLATASNDEDPAKNFIKDLKLCSGEIYISCACAIALSALLIVLFRRYADVIIWLVLGLVIAILTTVTMAFWAIWLKEKSTASDPHSQDAKSSASFVFALIFTIITLIVSVVIYAMRKSIRMVIVLFEEAGKVAQSMPLIIVQPFATLVATILSLAIGVYFFLITASAGFPQKQENGEIVYVQDELMEFNFIYNIVIVIWITQFLIGCQHMVIAGATATWFFTRNKGSVTNALSKSYRYLYKYHLGSVAFGSLIITAVKIIRFLYRVATRKNKGCCASVLRWFCKYLERIVTFLTRNAYIEIAIYGDGFWVSGKRALYALTNNAVKVLAINSVGDFVMILGRMVIVGCCVGIGSLLIGDRSGLHYKSNPLVVIGLFAFVVADAFMTAFEMIVDSIFICFCEDCDINDGIERPYYMNPKLMVFINKERDKVLRVGDAAVE